MRSVFCHSTCATCLANADPNSCITCNTALIPALTFYTINGTAGKCTPNIADSSTPNVVLLGTLDNKSVIGSDILDSIKMNGQIISSPGIGLNSILFKSGQMINFDTLTAADVTFNLKNLDYNHKKVYVRLNAMTTCSVNKTLKLTVAGNSSSFTSINSTVAVY